MDVCNNVKLAVESVCAECKVHYMASLSVLDTVHNQCTHICNLGLSSECAKSNDMDKRFNIHRVHVTRPSYCFVVDPLRPGGALSLISGVKMVTVLRSAVGFPVKSCQFYVTIEVRVS